MEGLATFCFEVTYCVSNYKRVIYVEEFSETMAKRAANEWSDSVGNIKRLRQIPFKGRDGVVSYLRYSGHEERLTS